MVQPVLFMNLFFVPMLSVYVIYRKTQKPLKANLDLMFQYGIAAACNVPFTKAFTFLIKKVAGIYISIDSGYYTVAALLPTIITILAYALYVRYSDHKSWKEKLIRKGIKGVVKDLAPAYILLFVCCFMMFVFEPILLYATNITDFWFDLKIMLGPVLLVFSRIFLAGAGIIFALYHVDLWISNRLYLYRGVTLIGFVVFFLLYLQGNWLAGNLPMLDGETIIWENYGRYETFVLIAAAFSLAAAIIISIRKRGPDRTVFYAAASASVVFVMLFASLVPTVLANKALAITKETQTETMSFSPSMKNFDTVSLNRNFLIFLVDTVSSKICYDVMMEDADFRGMLEDFTYYPDTLSVYPRTLPSIPNILTGTIYPGSDVCGLRDYCTNSYNQSPLFEKLMQNDYGINLYSSIWWKGEKAQSVENNISIYDSSVELNTFMAQELKYIKFKYLPYGLKQFSDIETLNFDASRITNSEYAKYSSDNRKIYDHIVENSMLEKRSQNYFQFVHCLGAHRSYHLDKNLNEIKGATEEQAVAACLTMIKAYLQRLKDNDAYDNSVIVIMSDHGYHTGYKNIDIPEAYFSRCNPILFIKGFNEKHEMLESDRPVSYMDLQDAFSDLIDGKQSTELFANLEPGRTRYWQTYYSPGIYPTLVEYETTGKAWEWEKCIPTGREFNEAD